MPVKSTYLFRSFAQNIEKDFSEMIRRRKADGCTYRLDCIIGMNQKIERILNHDIMFISNRSNSDCFFEYLKKT